MLKISNSIVPQWTARKQALNGRIRYQRGAIWQEMHIDGNRLALRETERPMAQLTSLPRKSGSAVRPHTWRYGAASSPVSESGRDLSCRALRSEEHTSELQSLRHL